MADSIALNYLKVKKMNLHFESVKLENKKMDKTKKHIQVFICEN